MERKEDTPQDTHTQTHTHTSIHATVKKSENDFQRFGSGGLQMYPSEGLGAYIFITATL